MMVKALGKDSASHQKHVHDKVTLVKPSRPESVSGTFAMPIKIAMAVLKLAGQRPQICACVRPSVHPSIRPEAYSGWLARGGGGWTNGQTDIRTYVRPKTITCHPN